jgi:hypothetical protein
MEIDFYLFGEIFKKRDNFFYIKITFKKLYEQAKMHH